MDPDRLAEIDAVFEQALALETAERGAFLDRRCTADPALRREVEALLSHSGREVDGLLGPVRAFADSGAIDAEAALAPGSEVGAYRVVGLLGRGGMGLVALGERRDGVFEQRVAIKMLPHAMSSPEAVRRFELERRILARLQHPNIAHLLDGGVDARGLPYLVMELVDGEAIDRYCDRHRLGVETRLRMVVDAAHAVHAAHKSLVIHRDIKPSNLLVDPHGRVKLLDFGIAKLIDPLAADSELTKTAAFLLTPTYASPEQVRGASITTASDVYQLGLLLYELLAGSRPQETTARSLAELVRVVCEREPLAPSRAVLERAAPGESAEERAARRSTTPERLARRCRGDLDAIVARCLEKDPERRYPSAEELAADLERHLDGRPVRARRATAGYRARKFLRRHVAAASAAALALGLTVTYAVGVTLQARAIARQRARAESEAAKATAVERFLVQLFAVSDPDASGNPEVTARELLARGSARVEEELAGQPQVQARLWSALGQIEDSLGSGEEARRLLTRALEFQERLPDEQIDGAETHRRLGVALRRHGERQEAERHLDIAVDTLRRLVSADDPRLALALAERGVAKGFRGDFAGATADLSASLDIRRRNGARAEIVDTVGFLGLVEVLRGDAVAAEPYYIQALAGFRALYGERHVKVAWAHSLLAETRRMQGDLGGALAHFTDAVAIHRALLGERHVEVGEDLSGMAMASMQLGRLDQADALYAESLAILASQLTPDHPS
jgi:serine/threonine-protein kinase